MLFTQIPPPVKGWMCSYNFFPFSIGFIYFLSALLLRLLWQSAFYLPSPFLCSQPISQNTITLAAPAAADADVLNSISIHCCNVRERDRYLPPPFFSPFLEGHIGGWCSSAHHDVAWISFSASGSSRDEYILTKSDRHIHGLNTQGPLLDLLPLRLEYVYKVRQASDLQLCDSSTCVST